MKWEVGALPQGDNANTAPATVSAFLRKSDTSLKTFIHDVAEGNIGGNAVFMRPPHRVPLPLPHPFLD